MSKLFRPWKRGKIKIHTPEIPDEYISVPEVAVEYPEVENMEYPYIESSRIKKARQKARNRKYSIEELDQRCEDAREALIAPLN